MQKYLLILLIGLTAACTTLSNRASNGDSQSRGVATDASQVYLNTREFPSAIHSQLLAGAEGKANPTFKETHALVEAYATSPEFEKIKEAYVERLYKILGINPEQSKKWIQQNAKLYKGIRNYVGDSGEGEMDQDPSWQTINGKLRDAVAFNSADQKFYDEIIFSLSRLPSFQGLAFRGVQITPERWQSLEVGKAWEQDAFTSTSIDPDIAYGFGSGQEGYSRRGVLVLKLKSGTPVSPLTFDHGKMGQPGRFREYEILLQPRRQLLIKHKVEDKDTCYVFAEEF